MFYFLNSYFDSIKYKIGFCNSTKKIIIKFLILKTYEPKKSTPIKKKNLIEDLMEVSKEQPEHSHHSIGNQILVK